MYSIKPGRGPSIMEGIGGIIAILFGIGWTFFAMSIGAPIFFAFFGVLFVIMAIAGVAYNFYNATNRNRMSSCDITRDGEESDPISDALGFRDQTRQSSQGEAPGGPRQFPGEFCPFCGAEAGPDFELPEVREGYLRFRNRKSFRASNYRKTCFPEGKRSLPCIQVADSGLC